MNWKKRCVNEDTTLIEVLIILQQAKGSVIYVVNDLGLLLGTITDGDIRRYLIENSEEDLSLCFSKTVMNVNFKYQVSGMFFDNEILDFSLLDSIPLCDSNGKIIDEIQFKNQSLIPIASPSLGNLERKYLDECFDSGFISSNSSMVKAFENLFLKCVQAEFGTSVSNGTVALELILKSLNLPSNSCIGVPNYTFAASINAVINCGFKPLILECNHDLLIDESKVPWDKLDAIIYVSLYGNAFNIGQVAEGAKRFSIPLIGDHAEGLGCFVDNVNIGNFCDASSYSFFANKLITTGEGGFVTFKNRFHLEKALIIKNHGMNPLIKYNHIEFGCNYRLTGLQAAIGIGQLEQYELFLSARRDIGKFYEVFLSGFNEQIRILNKRKLHESSYWLFPLFIDENIIVSLEDIFNDNRIEVRRIFQPLSDMNIYKDYIITEYNYSRFFGLVLPTHPSLSQENISRILNVIKKWSKQLQ
jgi:perosamine synthetase